MSRPPQFDHEKLEVYRLSVRFVAWAHALILEVKGGGTPEVRETCGQLDRSSVSTVLNIAEGNGRRATKQRARFFDDARGSATECAACLDILVAKEACAESRVAEGKAVLVSVVNMLLKLMTSKEPCFKSIKSLITYGKLPRLLLF